MLQPCWRQRDVAQSEGQEEGAWQGSNVHVGRQGRPTSKVRAQGRYMDSEGGWLAVGLVVAGAERLGWFRAAELGNHVHTGRRW